MKTNVFLCMMGIGATVLFSACGSSKQVAAYPVQDEYRPAVQPQQTVSPYGTAVQEEPCMALQQQSPATRAWGNGQHFKLATAGNIAEAQARAKFARAISAAVKTGTKENAAGMEKYAGNGEEGVSVADQGARINDLVSSIAEGIVKNAVVIKTTTYMQPNKQYNVFVCLEYQGGVEKMAADVTNKVKQQISDKDMKKMNINFDNYEEQIKQDLEKAGKEQQQ